MKRIPLCFAAARRLSLPCILRLLLVAANLAGFLAANAVAQQLNSTPMLPASWAGDPNFTAPAEMPGRPYGLMGKLYIWNLASKTLVPVSDDWWDAPLDLRNPSALTQAMIYYRQHQYRAMAMRSQGPDPNFPPVMAGMNGFSRNYLAETWDFQGNDLTRPLLFWGPGAPDYTLGFDERGSWIQNKYGGVYMWSFRTWRLELIASRLSNVPKAALVRLHNPDPTVTKAIGAPTPARP